MNCKLIGSFVQHLEVTLEPNEEFYAEKGSVIYMQRGVESSLALNGRGLGGLIGAKLSGENLLILRLTNIMSMPRKLVIGSISGLVPVKLNGETMICHRGVYVASSKQVSVTTKFSISGFLGGMGMMLQKITGMATVFLDSIGSPIVVPLPPGETIDVDENHVIALQSISESQLQPVWSVRNLTQGEGMSMLRITGPGQVYLTPGKFGPGIQR